MLGEWGFRRLTLKTDRRALIPRPETEVVVERALEHIRDVAEPQVLDVGTGTGAIALAIADEIPDAKVTAIDVSPDALELARENLKLTGINGRVRLVEHDLTSGLGEHQFDLVVSNPPYVEPNELETLQPEVRDWEPHIALVASGATEARRTLRGGAASGRLAGPRDRRELGRPGRGATRRARIRGRYDHARSGGEGPGGRGQMEGLTTRTGGGSPIAASAKGRRSSAIRGGPGFSSLLPRDLAGLGASSSSSCSIRAVPGLRRAARFPRVRDRRLRRRRRGAPGASRPRAAAPARPLARRRGRARYGARIPSA